MSLFVFAFSIRLVPVPVVGFTELQQRMKQQEQETLQHAKRLEVGHPSCMPHRSIWLLTYNKEINKITAIVVLFLHQNSSPIALRLLPSIIHRHLTVILAIIYAGVTNYHSHL